MKTQANIARTFQNVENKQYYSRCYNARYICKNNTLDLNFKGYMLCYINFKCLSNSRRSRLWFFDMLVKELKEGEKNQPALCPFELPSNLHYWSITGPGGPNWLCLLIGLEFKRTKGWFFSQLLPMNSKKYFKDLLQEVSKIDNSSDWLGLHTVQKE